jgi:Flp pilus assembly protein TadD
MISRHCPLFLVLLAAGFAAGGCVHTPPGTSVEVALAKKPEVVRLPTPPALAAAPQAPRSGSAARNPAVEPDLPKQDKTMLVADAFSRGQFCMKAGKDEEAISAFREVVKIDPTFMEGWQNLAMLYEQTGQEDKALEAFRKAKKIAHQ